MTRNSLTTAGQTVALDTLTAGTRFTYSQSHPRSGQVGTVLSALDRGELASVAGFNRGVWVLLESGQRICASANAAVLV